jgi:hypothetical protein
MEYSHLNGAKFATPVSDNVETNAIGRGTTALTIRAYASGPLHKPNSDSVGLLVCKKCKVDTLH